MKAIRIHQFGEPDVLTLEKVPVPEAGPHEVLVRALAAGVNPVDAKTRAGKALYRDTKPFPFIPGWDVSGLVVEKGEQADRFNIGDEVYGMVRFPQIGSAYAEYVSVPQDHLSLKPDNLSHIESAALPLVSLTAWQALFDAANLSRNQTVLIHAAAGGVGHIAVQLAKSVGAYIHGTASENHHDFLLDLGVDNLIDYRKTRFEEAVEGVDVVLDIVGGETRDRSWQVIKPGGVLVSLRSSPLGDNPKTYKVRGENILVHPDGSQMTQIARLAAKNLLRPHIFRVFPLSEAAAAHHLLETGHAEGKIVLSISDC